MNKCPHCGRENEDGALFCDQCKSDLSPPTEVPTITAHAPPQRPAPGVVVTLFGDKPWAPPSDQLPALTENRDAVEEDDPTADLRLEKRSKEPVAGAPVTHQQAAPATRPSPVTAAPPAAGIGPDARPRLIVLRGEKLNMQYPIYPGKNYIGRTDEKPVDIDLENQEAPDRIWSSRQHAVISFDDGVLTIEDLNSLNGTFVNRARIHPGQVRTLQANDIIQIGTVQLKVVIG